MIRIFSTNFEGFKLLIPAGHRVLHHKVPGVLPGLLPGVLPGLLLATSRPPPWPPLASPGLLLPASPDLLPGVLLASLTSLPGLFLASSRPPPWPPERLRKTSATRFLQGPPGILRNTFPGVGGSSTSKALGQSTTRKNRAPFFEHQFRIHTQTTSEETKAGARGVQRYLPTPESTSS